ncbi:hypothetical protein KSS87_019548 [Heliosperma pusillum]|nr:hypothetical protein KSS87_019548 [Heliosperma pusillum]
MLGCCITHSKMQYLQYNLNLLKFPISLGNTMTWEYNKLGR